MMEPKQDIKERTEIQSGFDPTEGEIRKRAYDIYLARDGRPGSPVQDWLKAEAEIRQARRIFL
jgi:Protein of unknown function (DUF2934)